MKVLSIWEYFVFGIVINTVDTMTIAMYIAMQMSLLGVIILNVFGYLPMENI